MLPTRRNELYHITGARGLDLRDRRTGGRVRCVHWTPNRMNSLLRRIVSRLRIIAELIGFLAEEGLWWLVPFVLFLFLIGVLVIAQSSGSPLVPFIYGVF